MQHQTHHDQWPELKPNVVETFVGVLVVIVVLSIAVVIMAGSAALDAGKWCWRKAKLR